MLSVFEKHQPNSLFYHNLQRADMRWGGSEPGMVPYPCWGTFTFNNSGADAATKSAIQADNFALLKTGDPDGKYFVHAMCDAPLRGYGSHEWFWEPGDEEHIFPVENLMKMYNNSVGHNTSLILGLTPNADGLIPDADVMRLKEFGDEIKRRLSSPIATTSGTGKTINLELPNTQKINQVVLMEDISKGEPVRKFVLECKTKMGWKTIFEGSSIGHKFIHSFDDIEVSSLRLNIVESKGESQIVDFSVSYIKY